MIILNVMIVYTLHHPPPESLFVNVETECNTQNFVAVSLQTV